jgi:hypothetical protein
MNPYVLKWDKSKSSHVGFDLSFFKYNPCSSIGFGKRQKAGVWKQGA